MDGEKINARQFEAWVEKFRDAPFMQKQAELIERLDGDLFVRQKIEHLSFEDDIPEELTADKYLLMYKKIWAIIRHDLYKAIQLKKKELRVNDLPSVEFDKLYEETHKKFEEVRVDVYHLIMGEEVKQSEARQWMQKAYVTFSTIGSTAHVENKEVKRSRWPDLVHAVAIEHGKYIGEMGQGKFYDNIETDPRDSAQADDKIDLKSLKAYKGAFSRQKTMIGDK